MNRYLTPIASILTLGGLILMSQNTEAQDTGIELRSGVVIDAEGRGYIMSPDSQVHAVDLRTGDELWTTQAAAKPIGVINDQLVCQAEPKESVGKMQVVTLDSKTGQTKTTTEVAMPAGVLPAVAEGLRGQFSVDLSTMHGDPVLAWQFSPRLPSGLPPDDTPDGRAPLPPIPGQGPQGALRGAFRLDLSSGQAESISREQAPLVSRQPAVAMVAAPDRVDVTGDQFLSADQKHIMTSKRVGSPIEWNKYEVTVFDRQGTEIGTFRSHVSHAPFVVVDSKIIYTTNPYTRVTPDGQQSRPLTLQSVDLPSGEQAWEKEVRDDSLQGPFPP